MIKLHSFLMEFEFHWIRKTVEMNCAATAEHMHSEEKRERSAGDWEGDSNEKCIHLRGALNNKN